MVETVFPITTERLIIRPYDDADLDDLFAIHSRPDVARYLYTGPKQNRAEMTATMERRRHRPAFDADDQGWGLAAELAGPGRVIGDLTLLMVSHKHNQGEIGFVFHPDSTGRGLATEAARVLLGIGFDDIGFHRIVGRCDARNDASAALMTRVGMRQEAHFVENEWVKGEWTGEKVFALRAAEWRS